jgi:flagellar motor switch protein FliN
MAEKDDLVEAALAAMEETDSPEDPLAEDDAGSDETPVDPFEAAQDAIEAVGSEGDAAEGGEGEAADPFEAALSALDDDDSGGTEDVVEDGESSEDPFAAALEIAKTEQKTGKLQKTDEEGERAIDIDFLMEIKLELTFEVGRTKMYISDLLSLGQGSVIELHRLVGEELELFVNGRMLATGEVVVINEKFGARISKILSPEDRIERLGADLDSFF